MKSEITRNNPHHSVEDIYHKLRKFSETECELDTASSTALTAVINDLRQLSIKINSEDGREVVMHGNAIQYAIYEIRAKLPPKPNGTVQWIMRDLACVYDAAAEADRQLVALRTEREAWMPHLERAKAENTHLRRAGGEVDLFGQLVVQRDRLQNEHAGLLCERDAAVMRAEQLRHELAEEINFAGKNKMHSFVCGAAFGVSVAVAVWGMFA